MKYRLTVEVDGDTVAENSFSTTFENYGIGVTVDDSQKVQKLYIERKVDDDVTLPSIKPGKGVVKHEFVYSAPEFRNEMIEKLIYLESIGSFWWRVRSFGINEVHEEWIPESEEEKSKLSFIGLSTSSSYRTSPQPIHDHQIKDLLEMEEDEKAMTLPLAFYREGSINFENHKYINAFQNYFLMIEGLYAGGKSGNIQQIKSLSASSELKAAVEKMIENIKSDTSSSHYKTLSKELEELSLTMDAEGVINWLVRTRGTLSHFSVKSTKKQGHPHVQRQYRTHAYVAQGVCLFIYTAFHTEVLRKRGHIK